MPGRPPTGRPPKLTPRLTATVVAAIEANNLIETAAATAGVRKETLYDWLRKGARAQAAVERGEQLDVYTERCVTFSDAVLRAQARASAARIAAIAAAGDVKTKTKTVTKITGEGDEATTDETTTTVEEVLGDWRAEAWLQERADQRWNIRVQTEAAGKPAAPGDDVDAPEPDPAAEIIVRIQGMRGRMATPTDQEGDDGEA